MEFVEITISKKVYDKLTRLKPKDQNYSDYIEKLLKESPKGSIPKLIKHYGCSENIPKEVIDNIKKARERTNKSLGKRIDKRLSNIND